MNPISVCIIAKNEEARIERLLNSLQPYSFEIVLVDTGSTDHTKELASHYTGCIYDFEWKDDFSAARNFSLEKASNNWIFMMDCDEWIETIDMEELHYFRTHLSKSVGSITRRNITGTPEQPGVTMDYTERFFDRRLFHYTGRIHEQLTPKFGKTFENLLLNTVIGHDGYQMTEEQRHQKAQRNISLLLEELQQRPEDPYLLYQLGKGYEMIPDLRTAVDYFRKALQKDPDPSLAYTQSLILSFGQSLLELQEAEQAVILERYERDLSDSADYLHLMGCIYYETQNYEKALVLQEKALACEPGKLQGSNSFLPCYEIGKILSLISEWKLARSYFLQCGDYPPALHALRVFDEHSL